MYFNLHLKSSDVGNKIMIMSNDDKDSANSLTVQMETTLTVYE